MKRIVILFLAALFAASGASAQKFHNAYYDTRRAAHDEEGLQQGAIVFLGNSITEQGWWSLLLKRGDVENRGIGGDCISGMIHRIGPIVEGQPRAIFIMGGANDLVFSKISGEKLLEQYERLLGIIARESPRTKIYIQSLLPLNEAMNEKFFKGKNARIAAFNALLRDMAARRGLTYIDIWSDMQRDGILPAEYTFDGIHLKADGYRIWIEKIRPYIK